MKGYYFKIVSNFFKSLIMNVIYFLDCYKNKCLLMYLEVCGLVIVLIDIVSDYLL